MTRPKTENPRTIYGTKHCQNARCQQDYEATSPTQRFCSRACRPAQDAAEPVVGRQVVCAGCNGVFVAKSTTHTYCTPTCRPKIGAARHNAVRYNPNRLVVMTVCPQCQTSFQQHREGHIYCSHVCGSGARKVSALVRAPNVVANACTKCLYGITNAAADTGWECKRHLAMRCRPLSPTPMFFEKKA